MDRLRRNAQAWFVEIALAAQQYTLDRLELLIAKTRLLDRLGGTLNSRQEEGLLQLLREGPDGFTGGLLAGNYRRITGGVAATARRDLGELVDLVTFRRTGQIKSTRYWLAIHPATSDRVVDIPIRLVAMITLAGPPAQQRDMAHDRFAMCR